MNNNTKPLIFRVPCSKESHELADKYAGQQVSKKKAKQVYLNTLAVHVGKKYLENLDFKTSLDNTSFSKSFLRMTEDVADVIIPDIGTFEFRHVLRGEASFSIPNPDKKEVVAYVAVAFDDSLDFGDMLGFVTPKDLLESNVDMSVSLDNLQPIERLPGYLTRPSKETIQSWNDKLFNDLPNRVKDILLGLGYVTNKNVDESVVLKNYFLILRSNFGWYWTSLFIENILEAKSEIVREVPLNSLEHATGLNFDVFKEEFLAAYTDTSYMYLGRAKEFNPNRTSKETIQRWSKEGFEKLIGKSQKALLEMGYNDSDDADESVIIKSYFMILRIDNNWDQADYFIGKLKQSNDEKDRARLVNELEKITRLNFDDFLEYFLDSYEQESLMYLSEGCQRMSEWFDKFRN